MDSAPGPRPAEQRVLGAAGRARARRSPAAACTPTSFSTLDSGSGSLAADRTAGSPRRPSALAVRRGRPPRHRRRARTSSPADSPRAPRRARSTLTPKELSLIATRSLARVVRASGQPPSTSPTTQSSGTKTPSRKTSLNSASPVSSRSGRIVDARRWACRRGSSVMPLCCGASGFGAGQADGPVRLARPPRSTPSDR